MNIAQKNIEHFVIVGGGTAGWMAAALLGKALQNTLSRITLVESALVASVGVGEATVPSFVDFINLLGIDEHDFIRHTNATYKLAIKFTNWQSKAASYWHPFGHVGAKIDGQPFFQHWLKRHINGHQQPFTDFSPSAVMADMQRIYIPNPNKPNNLSRMGYALHFDAAKVAEYLTNFAQGKGVKRIESHVTDTRLSADGRIQSLLLSNGETVQGDFFVDCSGQQALLIGKALKVSYLDWQHYLPVNSAVVLQSEQQKHIRPYTEATAHQHGWRWRIPLQNRVGNGYVYCDKYCSDEQAQDLLLQNIQGRAINTPRLLRFTTGKRDKMWQHNCVAIGLSSGFLEPLESTSIYLIMRGVLNFLKLLPNRQHNQATVNEYNRLMDIEYHNIRDFIVMHYCLSDRTDSAFWQDWQSREIPDSLKNKLALYQAQGRLVYTPLDLFESDSWHAVLTGMGRLPEDYEPLVDSSDFQKTSGLLDGVDTSLKHSVKQLLSHQEFLARVLKQVG